MLVNWGIEAGIEGESSAAALEQGTLEFQFEPDPAEVLGNLLPHYLNYQVYQLLLESKASEHSARMVAMKGATENAGEMISTLSMQYNRARQSQITSELSEIIGGAAALE